MKKVRKIHQDSCLQGDQDNCILLMPLHSRATGG